MLTLLLFEHEEMIKKFTTKQLEFVLNNNMNSFTIRKPLRVEWKRQLWVTLLKSAFTKLFLFCLKFSLNLLFQPK
jgi:hypothetical protein